jgi:hypothetical protein
MSHLVVSRSKKRSRQGRTNASVCVTQFLDGSFAYREITGEIGYLNSLGIKEAVGVAIASVPLRSVPSCSTVSSPCNQPVECCTRLGNSLLRSLTGQRAVGNGIEQRFPMQS